MADEVSKNSHSQLTRRELLAGAGAIGAGILSTAAHAAGQAPQAATTARPIVFTHTTVVTGHADKAALIDVALAISGDKVAAIGPTDQVLKAYPNAEVIDGRRKVLLPGIANCHAHLSATIQRGFNEDFGFPNRSFLESTPGRFLSREESTLMAVIGAIEGIRSGTTTVIDAVGNAAELAKTGQRFVLTAGGSDLENGSGPMSPERLAASGTPRFSAKMRDAAMQRLSDAVTTWHGKENGRVTICGSGGLTETASGELLQAIRAFCDKHNLAYTIHLSQTTAETNYMLRYHGVRPTMYLDRHGFLGPRFFAGHARYVDLQEVALLGKNKCTVSHQACMASNRGVSPPIPAMREAGVTIALGTDNNNNDMFAVMKVAMLTERIRRNDENPGMLPQPEDILEDAARGGARAANLTESTGSLDVGKKADIMILNTFKPYLVPYGRILSAWLHNGRPSDIESVMVGGKFIMRNHKILTVDEEALVSEAEKAGQRAWKQALDANAVTLPSVPGRPRESVAKVPTFTLQK